MKFLIFSIAFFIGVSIGYHFGDKIGYIDGYSQGDRNANMWWIDKKSTYYDYNELEKEIEI